MNVSKKIKYFQAGLALAASIFLGFSFPGSAHAQNGGGASIKGGGVPQRIQIKAVSGKVLQTMNSGGYTYALVEEKGGGQDWVALPKSEIAVGDEISCRPGGVMNNFPSRSLGRTFDHIVFSGGLVSGDAASAPPAAAAPVQAARPSKYKDAKAYTISEIFDQKASLAFKPVEVKAKVVKVNSGIMGKNWLHLQDGSGNQAKGTNELVVTTDSSQAKVGDSVSIRGKLSLDRDFGSGYHYDVIIEGADVDVNN